MKSQKARQMIEVKSIEDMARDYQRSDYADGTSATAFEHGAEWMRMVLTRWHDPKKELPTVINTDEDYPLLIKDARGKVWSGLYRAYNNTFWYDGITGRFHADVSGMQGWREIHENTKVSNESK